MNARTNIPSGSAGFLIFALAFAPVVIKKCKPAVKTFGEALSKAGEKVQKFAEPSSVAR